MIFHSDPTEATYRHDLIIDGQSISLDVMDTAGKVGFNCFFFFCLYSMCSCCVAYRDFAEKAYGMPSSYNPEIRSGRLKGKM